MTTKPETSPMTDAAIERLCERLDATTTSDHERGCEGRYYACRCGWDEETAAIAAEAAALIRSQAERVKVLEGALGPWAAIPDVRKSPNTYQGGFDAAFDLLEALADRMEANGDRERAGCLRACFARGTGGIGPIEYMVDILASEITAPVAWTNALSIEAVRERPKESAWLWGAPNGRINIPLYAHPLAVEGAPFRKGGVFDAPPFCPICGKTGTHFHGPDTVRQHREEQSK